MNKEDRHLASVNRKGYARGRKLAEREHAMARKEILKAERAVARVLKAQEQAFLKAEDQYHAQREAEGQLIELPAMVLRDGTVKSVDTQTAMQILDAHADHMYLDCETSGYWIGHREYELRTVQLGGEHVALVLDADDEVQVTLAAYGLRLARKLSAHSAMADIIPVVVAGLVEWDPAWGKMHDSIIYAKLTDPKLSNSEADKLKELASDLLREYAVSPAAEQAKDKLFKAMGCKLKLDATDPREVNGWYRVNKFSETMIRYAGSDVLDLAAVLRVLPTVEEAYTFPFDSPRERRDVARKVIDRERAVQGVAARVAHEGFRLDPGHIESKITEHETHRDELRAAIEEFTEGKITNPSASSGKNNVALALCEMYPGLSEKLERSEKTGLPSAAKPSLEKLTGNGPEVILAKSILSYRHDVTNLGLLLRPLKILCDEGDGRMRPIVYTINADTGRMSCVRPNGQQFSRQGGIRASVIADPGYLMVNADLRGCEILVGAALSGDMNLLEAETSLKCWRCGSMCDSKEGKNCPQCGPGNGAMGLHWMAAISAFGLGATKEHRYWCKRVIFSKLFGGSAAAGARQVGIPVQESQKIHDAFEAIAPVYAAWDRWLRQCYYDGSVVWRDFEKGENYRYQIPGQSKRGIFRAYSGRQIYINAPHAFGNYAIQGTARELLVDGMLRFHEECLVHPEWGASAIMPIHDELLCWVKAEYKDDAVKVLRQCMTTSVLSSPGFPVRVDADPELGNHAFWIDSS